MDKEQSPLEPEPNEGGEVFDGRQPYYLDPRVRREYLATGKISPAAFAVYATLCDYGITPDLSMSGIAAQSGMKTRGAARAAIEELRTNQLVSVKRRKDKHNHNLTNIYTLLKLPEIGGSKNDPGRKTTIDGRNSTGNSLKSCIDQSLVSGSDPVLNRDSQRSFSALPSPKPKPKTKTKTSKNDPETNKAIAAIIKAYVGGLPEPPVTDQYNHSTNRQAALDIFKAGYTCEQVKACVQDKSKEAFWHSKLIPLKTVANDIAAWQHAKGNGNGNGALPDWWPRDHYQRPHKYDPPLSDQEYTWAELYHATVLNDQWHCREKWPQLVAAHLKTKEAVK